MQEGDAYTVLPGSEFTVARTAQRNNESHYYINNRKVSTKEVTELLKAKGIDLDNNRFLILQVRVLG
jgi:structural maintenance of chromosome 4